MQKSLNNKTLRADYGLNPRLPASKSSPTDRTRMILTHVTIVVKDQNAALEFYTQKMGFEKRADYQNPGQPRWLTLAPKGQAIEMVLWQAGMSSDPNLPACHQQPGIGTRWVLEVDDCRKTFAELK